MWRRLLGPTTGCRRGTQGHTNRRGEAADATSMKGKISGTQIHNNLVAICSATGCTPNPTEQNAPNPQRRHVCTGKTIAEREIRDWMECRHQSKRQGPAQQVKGREKEKHQRARWTKPLTLSSTSSTSTLLTHRPQRHY
jgi:hypothetical protein